jgi:hypothetical protein
MCIAPKARLAVVPVPFLEADPAPLLNFRKNLDM